MSKARYVIGYPHAKRTLFWGGKTDDGKGTRFVPLDHGDMERLAKELEIPDGGLTVYKLIPVKNIWPVPKEKL